MDSSPSSPPPPQQQHQRSLTISQREQLGVEQKCADIYRILHGVPPHTQTLMLEIWRDSHLEFLKKGIIQLGPSFHVLDANRPWLCYWIIHSIALLGDDLDSEHEKNMVDFLSRCQDKDGGYAGGPGQMPHLATTYAAVNALATLGNELALSSINRDKIYEFLLRMKDSSGAFRMHNGGEIDVRACYCAVSVASMLNILDHELVKDVGDYISRCQTYEGGIAGEPGSEAHGGYTFCGLATMILINEVHRLDLPSLIEWIAFRQGVECGFQGRINKLVDGCYSFWQGGALVLAQRLLAVVQEQLVTSSARGERQSGESVSSTESDSHAEEGSNLDEKLHKLPSSHYGHEGKLSDIGFAFIQRNAEYGPLFQSIALQQYVLLCSQVLEGGFKDKPGKYRDFYHTCYCLSGLSISQYSFSSAAAEPPSEKAVLGPYSNLLEPVHPLHNVLLDKYYEVRKFFSS